MSGPLKILLVFITAVMMCLVIALPLVVVKDTELTDKCESMGGARVKTNKGYVCAKLEVIGVEK